MIVLLRGEAALKHDWPERAKPSYDNTAAHPSCPPSLSFPSTVRARRGLSSWLQWASSRGFQGQTEEKASFTHSPPHYILSGTQEELLFTQVPNFASYMGLSIPGTFYHQRLLRTFFRQPILLVQGQGLSKCMNWIRSSGRQK